MNYYEDPDDDGQAVRDLRLEDELDAIRRGEICGLENHGAGGCSDPDCPTRRMPESIAKHLRWLG